MDKTLLILIDVIGIVGILVLNLIRNKTLDE
jgi:hypothetical protein